MQKNYDIVIVGAGLAGCTAAILLARKNYNVCLLDKETFPRDKTCGDGLSILSLNILENLGVLDELLQDKTWLVDEVLLVSPAGHALRHKTRADKSGRHQGVIAPRLIMDNILVSKAKNHENIDVLENVKVTGLVKNLNGAAGVKAQIGSDPITIEGRFIIGADGAHSLIASQCGLRNKIQKHKAFSVRAYFSNVAGLGRTLEMHYEKELLPGYGWVFPTGKNSANAGVIVYSRFTSAMDIHAQFDRFIHENPLLKERFAHAVIQDNTYKGWPLPLGSFPGKRSLGNVLLTGDAASFINPVTGGGIYTALHSGELAAAAITRILEAGRPPEHAGEIYEKLWKKDFKYKEFVPSYGIQYLLSKPAFINFGLKTSIKHERLLETILGFTGV